MKKRWLSFAAAPAAAFLAAGLLSGCGDTAATGSSDLATLQAVMPGVTQELIDQANQEGKVTLYTGTWSDATAALVAGFNQHFPNINVEVFENSASKTEIKFLGEQRQGSYLADIVDLTDPDKMDALAKEGLLAEHTIANDAKFADDDKSTGVWYPLRRAMVGIAWNSNLVSDEEAAKLTWESAADPKWKGKGGVDDMGIGTCVISCKVWYMWFKEHGGEFLTKIGENEPRVYESAVPAAAALAAGDISILFNASETGLTPLFDKGAPVKWMLPEPGIGQITGQGIVAKAPHPNAAKLFQEYTFSEEGYKLWQQTTGLPVWEGMESQTKVSQESWYKVPSTKYIPEDATDPDRQLALMNKLFDEGK